MAGNRWPCRLPVIEIDFTQCHAFIVNFKRETLALSKFANSKKYHAYCAKFTEHK